MGGKPWTKTEDTILRMWYARKGPRYCATRLPGRTPRAVEAHAHRLGIQSGLPNGYVPLWWVAPRHGDTNNISTLALQKAQQDGVLRTLEGRLIKHTVPAWWADKYADELREENEREARTRSWLRTRDLARMAGMTSRSIHENIKEGYALGRELRRVERVEVRTPRHHYRYHPQQARMAINAWRASRRAA